MPALVAPDETFTISLESKDGTNTALPDRMNVYIYDAENNYVFSCGEQSGHSITVPARDEDGYAILQGTGARYRVNIMASKAGYAPMDVYVTLISGSLDTLNTLRLPAGLTRIEDYAFAGGAFQAVIIPDGCTYIGEHAFDGCDRLVYISYPAGYLNGGIEIKESAFDGCGEIVQDVRQGSVGR